MPFAAIEEMATVLYGHGLPLLKFGKPHVCFDLLDGPKPLIDDPQAIICKSAIHQRYYDPRNVGNGEGFRASIVSLIRFNIKTRITYVSGPYQMCPSA